MEVTSTRDIMTARASRSPNDRMPSSIPPCPCLPLHQKSRVPFRARRWIYFRFFLVTILLTITVDFTIVRAKGPKILQRNFTPELDMRTQRSWRPRATNLGKISPNRSSRKVMKTVCTQEVHHRTVKRHHLVDGIVGEVPQV